MIVSKDKAVIFGSDVLCSTCAGLVKQLIEEMSLLIPDKPNSIKDISPIMQYLAELHLKVKTKNF
jgi:hypothetical protein